MKRKLSWKGKTMRLTRWIKTEILNYRPPKCSECSRRAYFIVDDEYYCFRHEPNKTMVRMVSLEDYERR